MVPGGNVPRRPSRSGRRLSAPRRWMPWAQDRRRDAECCGTLEAVSDSPGFVDWTANATEGFMAKPTRCPAVR